MWVVDTCVLVDIADDDPEFGLASAQCLSRRLPDGLAVSPVTYVELAPVFDDSARLLEEFLSGLGIDPDAELDSRTKRVAFSAWGRHISAKRAGRTARRPVADVLIGAMAVGHRGLITRNESDFTSFFPDLAVVDPMSDA